MDLVILNLSQVTKMTPDLALLTLTDLSRTLSPLYSESSVTLGPKLTTHSSQALDNDHLVTTAKNGHRWKQDSSLSTIRPQSTGFQPDRFMHHCNPAQQCESVNGTWRSGRYEGNEKERKNQYLKLIKLSLKQAVIQMDSIDLQTSGGNANQGSVVEKEKTSMFHWELLAC
ncbi:hypothetical protein TNCV_3450031 [Trichonephila clavipes]|uniref:Uncharacterized protein n=1 Tax=Trichonephila clavipes TaxID=2585209 RepID=A0A8X7BM51_TRICX|nr:hypothetical protein TNCV_3450031 [Trichonephila clavipes]